MRSDRGNIGPAQQRQRYWLGGILLAFSVAMATVLLTTSVARWWRSLLFFPLWGGLLGVAQAYAHT